MNNMSVGYISKTKIAKAETVRGFRLYKYCPSASVEIVPLCDSDSDGRPVSLLSPAVFLVAF